MGRTQSQMSVDRPEAPKKHEAGLLSVVSNLRGDDSCDSTYSWASKLSDDLKYFRHEGGYDGGP